MESPALAENEAGSRVDGLAGSGALRRRETQPELLAGTGTFADGQADRRATTREVARPATELHSQGKPSIEQAQADHRRAGRGVPRAERIAQPRTGAACSFTCESPPIAAKCLKHMADAKTQEDQLFYLFHLRTLPVGRWTLDQRKEYFGYFGKERKKLEQSAGR